MLFASCTDASKTYIEGYYSTLSTIWREFNQKLMKVTVILIAK